MCGIAGIWNLNDAPLDRAQLAGMLRLLAHRGPDGEGVHLSQSPPLGLGHRRLAILDLSERGRQPMAYAENRYWITYNGEIYNFLELRRELEACGHRFVSETDTEVILAAYVQWGEDCQLKFNGMWAFAIWDARERRLFLSRDRFGVKPLLYLYDGQRFAFASEMKAFLALAGFAANFEPALVATTLLRSSVIEGTDQCLIRGLTRLPGGHCLTLRPGQPPQVRRWWQTLAHLAPAPAAFPEQCARYRELFLDACRLRMRSDVPIGTALSGGLDSSAVLCAMTHLRRDGAQRERLAGDWQRAFVASYPGTVQDERPFAELVINHTGARPVFETIDPALLPDQLDDYLFHFEEIEDIHLGPWMVYRAMRQRGVVVSLDGHGGDEALAGDASYPLFALRDALWRAYPGRVRELWQIARAMSPTGALPLARTTKNLVKQLAVQPLAERLQAGLGGTSPAYRAGRSLWTRMSALLGSTQALATGGWLRIAPGSLRVQDEQDFPAHFDSLDRQLYRDFHFRLLPTILRNFDRCSMAHGVEIRAPFMDWRLVCDTFALPSTSKLGGGFTKRVLRESLRGILPEPIRTRTTKIGFGNPLAEWTKSALKPFILDTIRSADFLESAIWDGKRVCRDVERAYQTGRYQVVIQAWSFVHAARLMRLFRERGNTPAEDAQPASCGPRHTKPSAERNRP